MASPITEADLAPEPAPSAPPGGAAKYAPISQDDLAPATFRGQAVPPGLIARLSKSDFITPVLREAAKGGVEGWGEGGFLSPEHAAQAADPKNWDGALRSAASVAGIGIATVGDTLQRIFNAGLGTFHGAVQQIGKEAGLDRPESLADELTAGAGIEMSAGMPAAGIGGGVMDLGGQIRAASVGRGPAAELWRVERAEDGSLSEHPVGVPPTLDEAHVQAAQLMRHFGAPQAVPAVVKAYEDEGRMPAEIHHDIQADPAMLGRLVAGEKPYEGTAVEPQAARAEASAAEVPPNTPAEIKRMNEYFAARPDVDPRTELFPAQKQAQILADIRSKLPQGWTAEPQNYSGGENVATRRITVINPDGEAVGQVDNTGGTTKNWLQDVYAGKLTEGVHTMALKAAEEAGATPAEMARLSRETQPLGLEVQGTVPTANTNRPTPEPAPTRPLPLKTIPGTGETMVPRLAAKIEAGAIEAGFTESFPDMPTRQRVNFGEQAEKIAALMTKDPDLAESIAMGTKAAPQGVVPELVLDAVERKAHAEGDVDLLRRLATQSGLVKQSSTLAVRLRALGERDPTNPVARIAEVQQAREADLTRRGADISGEVDKIVQEASNVARAQRSKMPAWTKLLDDLKCK